MLAEDPEHRPSPKLLADPAVARARRVAARPPRRGQGPLNLSGGPVWNTRTLAFSIATDPDEGLHLLRAGIVDRWLRRELGDANLAGRLEEVMRLRPLDGGADDARADGLLTMRAVAALDPLAPLCWRGIALWPDGLGPALAETATPGEQTARVTDRLTELVSCEAASHWAVMRPERGDLMGLRTQSRQWRTWLQQRGKAGGLAPLRYALNPLLPCASPILARQAVARGQDLLGALDAAAVRAEVRQGQPIDREIAAFITARFDRDVRVDQPGTDEGGAEEAILLQLEALAELQRRGSGNAVPELARWVLTQLAPAVAAWRHRARREALGKALAELADSGNLAAMWGVLDNPQARIADDRGYEAALAAAGRIDGALSTLEGGRTTRSEAARRLAHETTFGLAMMALTAAVVAAALS
jgi:hypothetical protein